MKISILVCIALVVCLLFRKNMGTIFGNTNSINNYLNRTIAYNGITGVSDDGLVLASTWALGSIPVLVEGQKIGFSRLNCATGELTDIVSVDTPPVPVPGYYAFPQKMIMRHQEGSVYTVVVAYNSWNFFKPLGAYSFVALYTLDISTGSLTLHGRSPVSQYIQGVDVDWDSRIVYTANNGVSTRETLRRDETEIFQNDGNDNDSELRAFKMNAKFDEISFLVGVDTGMDGVQVHVRSDGIVFFVGAAVVFDGGVPTLNPLTGVANRYGPTVVITYTPSGNKKLDMESIAAGPALGFAVATYENVLVVGGQAGYSKEFNVFSEQFETSGTDEILSYTVN